MLITLRLPGHPRLLAAALEGLCAVNEFIFDRVAFPSLYDTGIRYRPEDRGTEEWWSAPTVLEHGYGDCEDLVCWRVAELRVRGDVNARPRVIWAGMRTMHVLVEHGSGLIEDPSQILGMPAPWSPITWTRASFKN